jgi:regulator of CtrA degradation
MSEKRATDAGAVSFSERLASSQVFATLFRDGMALVEETATYLDGIGRLESKKLERNAALVYATESMRLTTGLMQIASWLLLHRAVNEGEISLEQASKERKHVMLPTADYGDDIPVALPARLRELIGRANTLIDRIRRLDATFHAPPARAGNPFECQLGRLRAVFERRP